MKIADRKRKSYHWTDRNGWRSYLLYFIWPSGSGGVYEISRSLRFKQMFRLVSRTPSGTVTKTWTWSGWIRRTTNGNRDGLFEQSVGTYTLLRIRDDNDRISIDQYGGDNFYVYTDGVFHRSLLDLVSHRLCCRYDSIY